MLMLVLTRDPTLQAAPIDKGSVFMKLKETNWSLRTVDVASASVAVSLNWNLKTSCSSIVIIYQDKLTVFLKEAKPDLSISIERYSASQKS